MNECVLLLHEIPTFVTLFFVVSGFLPRNYLVAHPSPLGDASR